MLKRVIIIAAIICFGGMIVFLFFFLKKQQPKKEFQTIKAIPINSFCVISVNNFPSFFKNNLQHNAIWLDITAIQDFQKYKLPVHFIDSLFSNNVTKMSFLNDKQLIISMHYTGNRNYDFLYSIGLETEINSEILLDFIKKALIGHSTIVSYNYDNIPIYSSTPDSSNILPPFYFSICDNILVMCTSKILIQSSIGQLKSNESLLKNPSFTMAYSSANRDQGINLYFDYKTIPKFLSQNVSDTYFKKISNATNIAGWSELDISLKNSEIMCNGITTTDSLDDNYFHLFSQQQPVEMEIDQVIPASTSILMEIGIENPQKFKSIYENCLKKEGSYQSYKRQLTELNTQCDAEVDKIFYDIVENEMCLALIGNSAESMQQNSYAVIRTKSRHFAEEKLFGILDSYSRNNNIKFETLKSEIKIDNDLLFNVYRMPIAGIPKMVYGGFFSWTDANYFTFIDNYLVFGNSVASLSEFVKSYVLNKTLKNDVKFSGIKKTLSDNYNFMIYSKIANSMGFYKNLLSEPNAKHVEKNNDVFSKFDSFVFQLSSTKGKLFNSIYLSYNKLDEKQPQTLWECKLDSTVAIKPTFVTNSATKEKDIFVQDSKNNIYFINKLGRILWKVNIKEKITSDIFEVDYFKNGKIQFAFSTENYIYFVDRLGNFVEHYPMQLPSASSAGMNIFDYDNNKNYRIIIPCQNKDVLLYTIDGKRLKDWDFEKSDAPIMQPIQYFKIKKNDYIVCADKYNVYILDRKGKKRLDIKEKFELSQNTHISVNSKNVNNADAFVMTDKSGNIKKIELTGKVTTIATEKLSPNHYFESTDLNNDGKNDFVMLDNKTLYTYDYKGNKLFNYTFDNKIADPFTIINFSESEKIIGVLDKIENQIYLITSKGAVYKGFPLQGNSLFSVLPTSIKDKKSGLIVGGNENFIYYYEIK